MKKEEWNQGLNHLDYDLVEEYVTKKDRLAKKKAAHSVWMRMGVIAACLCLIASAVLVAPMLTEKEPVYEPILLDATLDPNRLSGSAFELVVGTSGGNGTSGAPPAFQFVYYHIVVKAKATKVYEDVYYLLDTSSIYPPKAHRLVEMETFEVIHGENVPQTFLYMLPEYYFVDFSVYDSLLISMEQLGAENFVLRNGTKNKIEVLSLPVFWDYQDCPVLGNVIAFTDGIFDESLWQTDSWIYGYQFAEGRLENPEDEAYVDKLVVFRGCTESDAICEIVNRIENEKPHIYRVPSVVSLQFTEKEALAAMEYVKPFANGVFSQTIPYRDRVLFRRYINGCQTEETVTIDLTTQKVTYSEVRYSQEELMQLDNIAVHISNRAAEYAVQVPEPPHTDPSGKVLRGLSLYGWYVKANNKAYGVVKTVWKYYSETNRNEYYYDDSYTLYDIQSKTAKIVSRDELISIVGSRNVYRGEYGVGEVIYD